MGTALSLEPLVWGVFFDFWVVGLRSVYVFFDRTLLCRWLPISFARRQLRGVYSGRTFWIAWERMVSGTGWLHGSDVVDRRGCLFVG